jgi:hypothetical protein
MFRGPFLFLALLLLGCVVCPIFLPLAVLGGYPALLAIGTWSILRGIFGRLDRPAASAAIWMIYLGLIVTIHGILLCFDTALAGAPPTAEEKRFGTMLAYLGGSLAGASAVVAYVVDRKPCIKKLDARKPAPLDELLA